jgi:hypothetical protein
MCVPGLPVASRTIDPPEVLQSESVELASRKSRYCAVTVWRAGGSMFAVAVHAHCSP